MANFKSLTIWTIVLSFFIIVGAGHGIVCIGFLEVAGLFYKFNIGTEDFSLSLTASYDETLAAAALFSLVGHILLILSVSIKRYSLIFGAKIGGLLFLWIGFYYLTHDLTNDSLSQLSFFTGIPFLICSILLAYRIIKAKFQLSSP